MQIDAQNRYKRLFQYYLLIVCISLLIGCIVFFLLKWVDFSPKLGAFLLKSNIIPEAPADLIVRNVAIIIFLAAFSVIVNFFLLQSWGKSHPAYIFFLCLYLYSSMLELGRLWIAWINVYPIAISYAYTLSRIVYFGRVAGITCFFASSIFALGIPEKNTGKLLIILALTALTISYIMPIETNSMGKEFIFTVGKTLGIHIALMVIVIIAGLNYILLAIKLKYWKHILAIAALLCMASGKELLTYASHAASDLKMIFFLIAVMLPAAVLCIVFQKNLIDGIATLQK